MSVWLNHELAPWSLEGGTASEEQILSINSSERLSQAEVSKLRQQLLARGRGFEHFNNLAQVVYKVEAEVCDLLWIAVVYEQFCVSYA